MSESGRTADEGASVRRGGGSAGPVEAAKQADAYLREHLNEAVEKYLKENTSGGTLAVSSDAARELLPGYATPAERTANNFALGPASSRLADAVWQRAMQDGPTAERYIVEFLTGSPGSGKTRSVISSKEETRAAAIISEGMMDHFGKSETRIQQAIEAGFVPTLRLVYVSDPKVTARRAVARAMEHGRPVAISQMSRLYVEIPRTVAKLEKHFGDRLGVSAFDNSVDGKLPRQTSTATALRATGKYTVSTAEEAMLDELDKLRNDGRISPELYSKFTGTSGPSDTARGGKGDGTPGATHDGRPDRQDKSRGEG